MDELLKLFVLFLLPALSGLGAFIVRSIISRISILENKIQHQVTEPEVRQILSDKLDPIKEDLGEIKFQLNQIIINQYNSDK